jgi:hypothetical protein
MWIHVVYIYMMYFVIWQAQVIKFKIINFKQEASVQCRGEEEQVLEASGNLQTDFNWTH